MKSVNVCTMPVDSEIYSFLPGGNKGHKKSIFIRRTLV